MLLLFDRNDCLGLMYQLTMQAGHWPELDLDAFCIFLAQRLKFGALDLVTLVLSDDIFVQSLNAAYRGKNQPTNVLSFASDAEDELGDVILALETIQREAINQDKALEVHVKHLILHGSLHLLGYDHETDAQAEEMESLEIAILAEHGLPNPYDMIDTPIVATLNPHSQNQRGKE